MVGGEHKCAPADAAHAAAGHHQSSHHCHLLPDTPHTSTHPTGSLVLSIRQVFAIKESAQEVNRSPLMMTISVYLTNKGRFTWGLFSFPTITFTNTNNRRPLRPLTAAFGLLRWSGPHTGGEKRWGRPSSQHLSFSALPFVDLPLPFQCLSVASP